MGRLPWVFGCGVSAFGQGAQVAGGTQAVDAVVMFKTIILSALYNLSDDQVEHQIRDRLSFMRFWGWVWRTGFPMPRQCGCTANS